MKADNEQAWFRRVRSNNNFLSRRRNLSLAALLLVQALAASVPGHAQIGMLYRLNADSSYQQGCFPPCLCPVMIAQPVTGTFQLIPTGFDALFLTYAVSNVNWIVSMGGTNLVVTGSGTYKIGGEFALQQELSLDLSLGGGPAEHFDSGLVTGPSSFPNINVTISLHGEVCFDTVFVVSASPSPLDQIPLYFPGKTADGQNRSGL